MEVLRVVIVASTRTLPAVTFSVMSDSATPVRTEAIFVLYACWSNDCTVPETNVETVTIPEYPLPGGTGGKRGDGGGGEGGMYCITFEEEAAAIDEITTPTISKT